MGRKIQLTKTRARLQSQGALFVRQTTRASGTLVNEARDAGIGFAEELTTASKKFAASTSKSAGSFGTVVQQEATSWSQLALKTRNGYVAELQAKTDDLGRSALEIRSAVEPTKVETLILKTVKDVLDTLQARVDARLQLTKPAPKKARSRSTSKAGRTARTTGGAPIRNYDRLTARDVVTRIQRLSVPRANEVLHYEQAGKNRATVIRAAKQRLAAA